MQTKLRILFTGDMSLTGVYHDQVARRIEIFDERVLELFDRHDFTVVNLEGPATSAKQIRRSDQDVVSPSTSIPYLAARGITVFNLANNHILDCGLDGFKDTVAAIDARGCHRFGAGFKASQARQSLYLSRNGVTVALIGVCHFRSCAAGRDTPYGTFYDESIEELRPVIDDARKNADYVVLNYHGGEEYTTMPMPSRRDRLRQYAELGVDLIVGHHSHTLQGHESHANCEIFYSLGNFAFDVEVLRRRHFTEKSALLSTTFSETGVSFEFIPIECDWRNGRVVRGAPSFHEHIHAISDFSNYRELWRRDAYRTYFRGRRADELTEPSRRNLPSERRRKWAYLLRPKTYLALYRQLRSHAVRPILIAAIQEAIGKLFKRT